MLGLYPQTVILSEGFSEGLEGIGIVPLGDFVY
jgi:hypothetical protein